MYFMVKSTGNHGHVPVNLRCPECRQRGTFLALGQSDLSINDGSNSTPVVGMRKCPDPECAALLFFAKRGQDLVVSYPPELIDFDASNLPERVLHALREAISCHANECFTAAAIMVRKTLEELCRDRGAEGNNLNERLRALGSKVVLPQELLDGLDDLRLLGNDAAHVESRTYSEIGKNEMEISLEFTKEVLKAVYQYAALLGRLRTLRRADG